MGCNSSQQTAVNDQNRPVEAKKEVQNSNMDEAPTARDFELIRETWALVALDLKRHGTVVFLRLFELNPRVQTLFEKIKDVPHDQLAENQFFILHATRVMETIDVAVKSLHDLAGLAAVLKQLGAAHVQYDIKPEHFQPVGGALLYALEKGLADKFTPEAKTAWVRLYGVVTQHMSSGLKG